MLGRKNKNNEIIGLEIELEETNFVNVYPWKVEVDHSLKLSGQEFTLCLHSDKTQEAIDFLLSRIQGTPSSRTSVHVHLNAQDMEIEQLQSLVALYFIFEKALYKFSGYRWDNIFCVPLNSFLEKNQLFNFNKWNQLFTYWTVEHFKYSGLNLSRISDLGTIEFRSMRGNKNSEYIQTWVNILVSLKKYAMTMPIGQLKDVIISANCSSAYWWLLKSIFGQYSYALNYPEFQEDIEESILKLKAIMFKDVIESALFEMEELCAASSE